MAYGISIAKDIIVAIAAFIGACVAIAGLSTWRRQLKGQADHELARRILVSLYRYRDAINGVRHPAMMAGEFPEPSESQRAHKTDAQIRFSALSNAYGNRWQRVQTQRVALHADLLESEALWGAELKTKEFSPIFSLEWELQVCVRNYLIQCDPDEREERKTAIAKLSRDKRDVLYDSLEPGGDEFSKALADAMGAVETYLKPKLARD